MSLSTIKPRSDGKPAYFISVIQDIHARKAAEEALADLRHDLEHLVQQRTHELLQRESELRTVIENAYDAYVSIDETGHILSWNRQAEETFGWSALEVIGKPLEELIIPAEMREAHRQGMARYLRTGKGTVLDQRLEVPAQRRDGARLMVELRIRAFDMGEKKVFSAFLHDITERKTMEAQREHEAKHDALTGLLNRRAFIERLPQAQARADRSGKPFALLFIDLDGFKAVNDNLGHEAGDALLQGVAQILLQSVRQTDSVVRLAGDEFTVLLEGLQGGSADGYLVAEKILSKLALPFTLPQGVAKVAASIGMAMYAPGSDQKPDALIREADKWMYAAKRAGKGQVLPKYHN
jgi:diguanylate cyclase